MRAQPRGPGPPSSNIGTLKQREPALSVGEWSGPVAQLCPGAQGPVPKAQEKAAVMSSPDSETCSPRAPGHWSTKSEVLRCRSSSFLKAHPHQCSPGLPHSHPGLSSAERKLDCKGWSPMKAGCHLPGPSARAAAFSGLSWRGPLSGPLAPTLFPRFLPRPLYTLFSLAKPTSPVPSASG